MSFEVKPIKPIGDDKEMVLLRDEREALKVSTDTLNAFISPFRAVLFQRESKPFTKRDMELRRIMFEMFDKSTPTPFPFGGSYEPKFEVEKVASTPASL